MSRESRDEVPDGGQNAMRERRLRAWLADRAPEETPASLVRAIEQLQRGDAATITERVRPIRSPVRLAAPRHLVGLAAAAVVALAVIGTGFLATMALRSGPAASPSAAASGAPASPPSASASPGEPAPLPSAIAYAIHQRQDFGFRADLAWVESVAADPRSQTFGLDFLMLPEEAAWWNARTADLEAVVTAAEYYGTTVPDQYAGVYKDLANGTVVAQFTTDPSLHRMRILEALGKAGPLVVRQVRYTSTALEDLQATVSADWDWLGSVGAAPMGVGVRVMDDRVELDVSSANPAIAAVVLAHYGVPADMLSVVSDGTGVRLMARGWVDVSITVPKGWKPPDGGLDLSWTGDGPGECGGEIGYGVEPGGVTRLPCTVGGWTIEVGPAGGPAVGHGHATVKAGEHAKLAITVP
jgi:hypothetical protein